MGINMNGSTCSSSSVKQHPTLKKNLIIDTLASTESTTLLKRFVFMKRPCQWNALVWIFKCNNVIKYHKTNFVTLEHGCEIRLFFIQESDNDWPVSAWQESDNDWSICMLQESDYDWPVSACYRRVIMIGQSPHATGEWQWLVSLHMLQESDNDWPVSTFYRIVIMIGQPPHVTGEWQWLASLVMMTDVSSLLFMMMSVYYYDRIILLQPVWVCYRDWFIVYIFSYPK